MNVFRIVLGGLLVASGRRLYWLFVAGFGFLLGLRIAGSLFQNAPNWIVLGLAFIVGLLGAVLAVTLQKFGIGLAGFLAGAYIAFSLMEGFAGDAAAWYWIVYLIGGIAGAILLTAIFEWALILLSSIGGSIMLLQGLELASPWNILLFIVLLITGISLQAFVFRRKK